MEDDVRKKLEEMQANRDVERNRYMVEIAKDEAQRAAECVQKKDLVDGAYYRGQCRNATVARWFAAQNRFTYWRTKFGNVFLEDINHPADDIGYDMFYPFERIDEPTDVYNKIPRTEIEQLRLDHPDKFK